MGRDFYNINLANYKSLNKVVTPDILQKGLLYSELRNRLINAKRNY